MKAKIANFFRKYKQILEDGKTSDKVIGWLILGFVVWFVLSTAIGFFTPKEVYIPTSDFVAELQNGNVEELHIANVDGTVNGVLREPTEDGIVKFSSHVPERSETFTQQYLDTANFQWDYAKSPEWVGIVSSLVLMLIQIGLLVGAMFWIFSKMQGDSSPFSFGNSNDDKWSVDENVAVTFDDVVGIPEAIEEMTEVLTIIKDPDAYLAAGAEKPTGVLLQGAPGNGKSLLAASLANEAGCKFLSANGSDFVRLYVGQGPKAIRELFAQARQSFPDFVIVFIDEIDAIGQSRQTGGDSGADKEYSSALNALLSEMTRIQLGNEPILVIGATNRVESLDPALVRKGRFDRIIQIDPPAKEGRIEILKHYAQDRPFAEPVDFDRLAKHTYGFSGADLKNVMNEASTLAARRAVMEGDETIAITKEDLDEAISRTITGPAMKSRKMSDIEKKQVAYHEAGHAVVQYILPECDPVQKISIVSRNIAGVGAAMGYVQSYSEEDSYVVTSAQMKAELAALMAGRASEKMFCNIEGAGAYDDLRKASSFAYDMVNKYAFENVDGKQLSWKVEVPGHKVSASRMERNDELIEEILDRAYDMAYRMLASHRAEVRKIVEVLLEDETIDSEQIKEIMSSFDASEHAKQEQTAIDNETLSVEAEMLEDEVFIDADNDDDIFEEEHIAIEDINENNDDINKETDGDDDER